MRDRDVSFLQTHKTATKTLDFQRPLNATCTAVVTVFAFIHGEPKTSFDHISYTYNGRKLTTAEPDQRQKRLISFDQVQYVQIIGTLLRQRQQQLKQRLGIHLSHSKRTQPMAKFNTPVTWVNFEDCLQKLDT